MLPSNSLNYTGQLDYSWKDMKVKADDLMQEARVIVQITRTVLARSQQLRENLRKPDKRVSKGHTNRAKQCD